MAYIGFVGKAGSGKDEACKILVEEYGYEQRAFADPMREIMRRLNPIVSRDIMLNQLRWNDFEYDEAKATNFGEGRRLMQVLGTEIGRDMFGENFWVDLSLNDANDFTCWSDVRFFNEADAMSEIPHGYVVRIERPDAGLDGDNSEHASEVEMDEILADFIIENTGSLEDFHDAVRTTVEAIMADEAGI